MSHILIPEEAHPYSRGGCDFQYDKSPFAERHIPIPGEDVYSFVIHHHREWGCDSPGMHTVDAGCLGYTVSDGIFYFSNKRIKKKLSRERRGGLLQGSRNTAFLTLPKCTKAP